MLDYKKNTQSCNDFIDQMSTEDSQTRYPKFYKTKFMKQLNYRAFSSIKQSNKSQLSVGKSKQLLIQRVRARQNKISCQIGHINQGKSPKAKVLKGDDKKLNLNGYFIIQFPNGNKFEGKYQFGFRIHGKMIYLKQKCQYQGGFIGQKFSGKGKLKYHQGREIEGQWDDMSIIGNATIKYPNNDIYYGKVDANFYKHGEGYLFLNNGCKYVGKFNKGSITGIEIYYNNKGELQAKGIWKNGKLIKDLDTIQQGESLWSTLQKTMQLPQQLLVTLNQMNAIRTKTSLSI